MPPTSVRSLPYAPGNDEHELGQAATGVEERGPRVTSSRARAGTAVSWRKELER